MFIRSVIAAPSRSRVNGVGKITNATLSYGKTWTFPPFDSIVDCNNSSQIVMFNYGVSSLSLRSTTSDGTSEWEKCRGSDATSECEWRTSEATNECDAEASKSTSECTDNDDELIFVLEL